MEKKLFQMPYDKEYTRTAILKHEEIFREQVRELHRLYRIQKVLMNTIEQNHSHGHGNDCHQRKGEEYIAESSANEIDESEIELTLGPSVYNNRRRKTKKPSSSGQSLSSTSTGSSQIRRTSPMEYQRTEMGNFLKASETEMGFNINGQESNLQGGENFRRDALKQPPLLFQALSLRLN
ncbi:hypothetical protein Ancab_003856 [Ancistrocladus abbreviatus]